VILNNFGEQFKNLESNQLLEKMVKFSERLESGITNFEFGDKVGPFEANLHKILRLCEFVSNEKPAFDFVGFSIDTF
jgi:hypothetical protein